MLPTISTKIEVESLGQLSELAQGTSLIVFTQPATCVPCQRLKPHLDKLSEQSEVQIAIVDFDKVPEAISEYDIMSIPQVWLFKDGEKVAEISARTVVPLRKEIDSHLA